MSLPTRRTLLRAAAFALVAAPLARLGQLVARQVRRHPRDLPPVPWIGHC
jgi:hypothetical protein